MTDYLLIFVIGVGVGMGLMLWLVQKVDIKIKKRSD
jgi:hypothetical protein